MRRLLLLGRHQLALARLRFSLCAVLRRTSASSTCCVETRPSLRSFTRRWYWRSAAEKASCADSAAERREVSVSRIEVSSRRTSASPVRTGSPFSFRTASTTAETSARRSARFSGRMEPVMVGPGSQRARCHGEKILAASCSVGGASAVVASSVVLVQPAARRMNALAASKGTAKGLPDTMDTWPRKSGRVL